jgi:hypothetical protein
MTNANVETFLAPLQFSRRAFCASSRASFSASACKPRRHRRSYQAPLVLSPASVSSLGQCLVCQLLAGNAIYKAIEPSQCVVFDITLVQPESEFINVAIKMLGACVMIDTDQSALENRENAFDTVSGHTLRTYSPAL